MSFTWELEHESDSQTFRPHQSVPAVAGDKIDGVRKEKERLTAAKELIFYLPAVNPNLVSFPFCFLWSGCGSQEIGPQPRKQKERKEEWDRGPCNLGSGSQLCFQEKP